jgi:hypothetical protein
MKKVFLYISLAIFTVVVSTSCKNDLDVLAPGEESVSVYGILNPNESVQNIRINKVFLTDGDLIAASQDANQINYGPGELRVSLQRFIGGSNTPTLTTVGNTTRKEIVMTETVITTGSGSFNQTQRIWQTTDKLYGTGEYKLTVTILSSGKEITSRNVVVDSVKSNSTMPFISSANYPMHGYYDLNNFPIQANALVNYTATVGNVTSKIKFKSVLNAKLYDVVMRFHYKNVSITNDTTLDYVDFNFSTQKVTDLDKIADLEVQFGISDFYTNLGNEVPKKPTVALKERISHYMEYIIYAGAESLDTFLQVNQPSTTIAQDKPSYSNINGGVGIFSARSRSIITHDLSPYFIDKIACNANTNPLGFVNSLGIKTTSICQ